MMKALLVIPTMLFAFWVQHLPIHNAVQTPANGAGKSIKAEELAHDPVKLTTIVIDPGHGGHDPGCLGAHSREKHLALAIGKYFAEALKKNYPDLKVIMTRDKDVFIPLEERAQIATKNKADLFVSIHCNYIPKRSSVSGTETYVLGLHATEENLEVAKRENSAILYEDNYMETYGYDPNSPEAHIIFSMYQNAFLEQSIRFAEKVQKHASLEASRRDRGVKQAGFLVLRHATMPSVLVEAGYLSNAAEENYLRSKKGQVEMANALLVAFSEYKNEVEGIAEGNAVIPKKLELDEATGRAALTEAERPVAVAKKKEEKKETPPAQTATIPENPKPSAPAIAVAKEEAKPEPKKPETKADSKPLDARPETKTSSSAIIPIEPVTGNNAGKAETMTPMYCVQLAASATPLDVSAGKWKKLDFTVEVIQEGGMYKYQIRNFTSRPAADAVRRQVRSAGFSDAFLVAYLGHKKVNPYTLK
jgi:N-acetylmuramoyl-L-alanine amidase